MDEILERLRIIEEHVIDRNIIVKNVLTLNEACRFLELSPSHLYKLTSSGNIPHYKPNGKKIYFNRVELEQWLLSNRIDTEKEVNQQAADYLINNKKPKL